METQSDFLISSPEKIISKLSVLLKNKNLLTAKCSEQGSNFVTTVLEVDKKEKSFICDGCEEDLAEQILKSRKVLFKTEHMGALVTFDATKITKIKFQGNLAFSIAIPSTLRWLEQREFYRMRVPPTNPSFCQILLDNKDPVRLKLYDISIRGFSMLNTTDELTDILVTGARFEECKLILNDGQEINISFEIRSSFQVNPNNLNKADKIGCQFSKMTPTLETIIHGYMLTIERELLKKRVDKTAF